MLVSIKLPRRSPPVPARALCRPKGLGREGRRQARSVPPPQPAGAGKPSAALAALLPAHELTYGHVLYVQSYGLPDLAERQQAEETFRALLHTRLSSDADHSHKGGVWNQVRQFRREQPQPTPSSHSAT